MKVSVVMAVSGYALLGAILTRRLLFGGPSGALGSLRSHQFAVGSFLFHDFSLAAPTALQNPKGFLQLQRCRVPGLQNVVFAVHAVVAVSWSLRQGLGKQVDGPALNLGLHASHFFVPEHGRIEPLASSSLRSL